MPRQQQHEAVAVLCEALVIHKSAFTSSQRLVELLAGISAALEAMVQVS